MEDRGGVGGGRRAEEGDELEEEVEEEEVEDGGFQVEVAAASLQGMWDQQVSPTGSPFYSRLHDNNRYSVKALSKAESGFQTCCQKPRRKRGITCQSFLRKGPHQCG